MTDWLPTDSGLFLRNAAPNPTGIDPILAAMKRFSVIASLMDGDNDAMSFSVTEELLVVGTGATTTGSATAPLLAANSLTLAVTGLVLVAIPTATTFTVGATAQPAKFATGVAVAAGTSFVGFLQWNPAVISDALGPRNVTAASIVVDPSANPATATGVIRLRAYALEFKAPAA